MSRRRRWFVIEKPASRWSIAIVAAIVFVCGIMWHHVGLLGGGAVGLCLVLRRVSSDKDQAESRAAKKRSWLRFKQSRRGEDPTAEPASNQNDSHNTRQSSRLLDRHQNNGLPKSTDALVDELLATSRYALLLR